MALWLAAGRYQRDGYMIEPAADFSHRAGYLSVSKTHRDNRFRGSYAFKEVRRRGRARWGREGALRLCWGRVSKPNSDLATVQFSHDTSSRRRALVDWGGELRLIFSANCASDSVLAFPMSVKLQRPMWPLVHACPDWALAACGNMR